MMGHKICVNGKIRNINPVTAYFLEQWLACLTGFEGELLRKKKILPYLELC